MQAGARHDGVTSAYACEHGFHGLSRRRTKDGRDREGKPGFGNNAIRPGSAHDLEAVRRITNGAVDLTILAQAGAKAQI